MYNIHIQDAEGLDRSISGPAAAGHVLHESSLAGHREDAQCSELLPWDPQYEIVERRLVRPEDFLRTLSWGSAPSAAVILTEGLKAEAERGHGWPLVMLRLAEVDPGRLEELVTDAWRMRAPQALAADLDGVGDPPEPDEARPQPRPR